MNECKDGWVGGVGWAGGWVGVGGMKKGWGVYDWVGGWAGVSGARTPAASERSVSRCH